MKKNKINPKIKFIFLSKSTNELQFIVERKHPIIKVINEYKKKRGVIFPE